MKENLCKPYIGVTGIAAEPDARTVAEIFQQYLNNHDTHEGMAGFLISQNILNKGTEHPKLKLLPVLLQTTGKTGQNCIHYIPYDSTSLGQQVNELFSINEIYNRKLSRTIQLNMRRSDPWPSTNALDKMKDKFPDLNVILQLNAQILDHESQPDIANQLKERKELIDYVLIDPSGGKGIAIDPSTVVRFYRISRHVLPDKPVIFAGGFDNNNVVKLLQILNNLLRTNKFGIDAQSGLRQNNNGSLSPENVDKYVKKSATFFVK